MSSRAMCALTADDQQSRFLVGTCSLQPRDVLIENEVQVSQIENDIHLLHFNEEANRIDLMHSFKLRD